jgi:hypothetical protein
MLKNWDTRHIFFLKKTAPLKKIYCKVVYLIYLKKKQLHLPVTTEELKPPQLSPDSSKHKCCVATTRVLPLLANQDIHSRKSLQKNENKGNLHDFSMSFLNWRYDFLFCFVLSATLNFIINTTKRKIYSLKTIYQGRRGE